MIMIKYFGPERQPPLPMVELPASLNAFKDDIVHIYAKMPASLPVQNVNSPRYCLRSEVIVHPGTDIISNEYTLNDSSAAKQIIIE